MPNVNLREHIVVVVDYTTITFLPYDREKIDIIDI